MSEQNIATCPGPDPSPRPPRFAIPPMACDTHVHVFGPASKYPYSPARGYTPPDAPLEALLGMHRVLGIERVVLTQPSVYGTDNRAVLDALAQHGERMRAVATVAADITDDDLERLDHAGVRGIRVNLVDPGGMPFDSMAALEDFARRIAPLGWHIELLIHVSDYPDLRTTLGVLPVDLVVGHLGYMPTDAGLDNPGFHDFLALIRDGRCWVKLTGPYRISTLDDPPYADVTPFARTLIETAPDRMLWGTDWPHPIVYKPMPNDGDLLDHLERDVISRNRLWIPTNRVL